MRVPGHRPGEHPPHEEADAMGFVVRSEIASRSLAQRGADVREYGIHGRRNIVDARDANQCDQGYEQCIFHQILTLFTVLQALEFHVQLQKCVAHFVTPFR
jgi:hypothetical protein